MNMETNSIPDKVMVAVANVFLFVVLFIPIAVFAVHLLR